MASVNFNQLGLECPICMEPYNVPKTIIKCKHIFCAACIHLLPEPKTCPLCRGRFSVESLKDNNQIAQRISELSANIMPDPSPNESSNLALHTTDPHQLAIQSAQKLPFKRRKLGERDLIEIDCNNKRISHQMNEFSDLEPSLFKRVESLIQKYKGTAHLLFVIPNHDCIFITHLHPKDKTHLYIVGADRDERVLYSFEDCVRQLVQLWKHKISKMQIAKIVFPIKDSDIVVFNEAVVFSSKLDRMVEIVSDRTGASDYLVNIALNQKFCDRRLPGESYKTIKSFQFDCFRFLARSMSLDTFFAKFHRLIHMKDITQHEFQSLHCCIYEHPKMNSASLAQMLYLIDQFMVPNTQKYAISQLSDQLERYDDKLKSVSKDNFGTLLFYAIRYQQSKLYDYLMSFEFYIGCRHNTHQFHLYITECLYSENIELFDRMMKHQAFKHLGKRFISECLDIIKTRKLCIKEPGWERIKSILAKLKSGIQVDVLEPAVAIVLSENERMRLLPPKPRDNRVKSTLCCDIL